MTGAPSALRPLGSVSSSSSSASTSSRRASEGPRGTHFRGRSNSVVEASTIFGQAWPKHRVPRVQVSAFLQDRQQQQQQHPWQLQPQLVTQHEALGWRRDLSDHYSVHGMIGKGSFGEVFLGQHKQSGREVAVKTMKTTRGKLTRSGTLGKISREVRVMQRVQGCPGVVQLLDCFEDAEHCHLVTELVAGGDLKKYVETHGTLDEASLAVVASEVFKIIKACHAVDVLYSDVKPANLCLADPAAFRAGRRVPNQIKLVDFGCSQQLLGGETRSSKRSGTLAFLSPEVFMQNGHAHKADVWSAGVTLYWLFAQRLPFWPNDEVPLRPTLQDVTTAVTRNPIAYDYGAWEAMSPEGVDFVQRCLQRTEGLRMSVDEALSHPWLQGLVEQEGQGDEQGQERQHMAAAAAVAQIAWPDDAQGHRAAAPSAKVLASARR